MTVSQRAERKHRYSPRVGDVVRLLYKAYPNTNLGNQMDPLDELAYVILSGQTTERLFQSAFRNFKGAFPRWEDVEGARLRDLERALRIGGLSRQKARFLREIARRVRQDFGAATLQPLRRMHTKTAEKYLCSLPGVGVKTARCVLMYSLGRAVFPLDTHCLRVMERLGWIERGGRRPDALADIAQNTIPPKLRGVLHVRFVQHGRSTCKVKPACKRCVLRMICPSAFDPRLFGEGDS